ELLQQLLQRAWVTVGLPPHPAQVAVPALLAPLCRCSQRGGGALVVAQVVAAAQGVDAVSVRRGPFYRVRSE
ncbi:MAG TPA: hypothetical protein VK028_02135, partial [Micromonosporaceae bacterium]|nr:hypothetical protein [Micromonosporaceae bacterium]